MESITRVLALAAMLLSSTAAHGGPVYKSVAPDGSIVYSDKPPDTGKLGNVGDAHSREPPPSIVPAARVPDASEAHRAQNVAPNDTVVSGSAAAMSPREKGRSASPEAGKPRSDISDQAVVSEAESTGAEGVPSPCAGLSNRYNPASDQVELLDALRAGRFAFLENKLAAMYRLVQSEHCSDRPIAYAFLAFDDASTDLELRYSQWIASYPQSEWPLVARGAHYLNRATLARGAKAARETSKAQFDAMHALFAKAAGDLNAALRINPRQSIAASKMVVIARYELGHEANKALFERYRKSMPASYELVSAYSRSLSASWGGDPKSLIEFADEAARHTDLNPDFALMPSYAVCLLAGDLRGAGRGEEAEILKEKAALQYADRLETWCYSQELQARASMNKNANDSAVSSGNPNAFDATAPRPKHRQTIDEGKAYYDRLLRTQHGDAGLYCRRAYYSYYLRNYDEAIDFVGKGIALNPREPVCLREQSKLSRLAKPGMPAVPMEMLAAAVIEAPGDSRLHYEYGLALINAHRNDAADAQLTETVALEPDFAYAWYKRGYVRSLNEQPKLALADIDKAIALNRSVSNFWAWRGYVHFWLMHQPNEALADYQQAVLLGADDGSTHLNLALTYESLKDCRSVGEFRKVASRCSIEHCGPGIGEAAAMKLSSDELRKACSSQFERSDSTDVGKAQEQ